MAAVSSIEVPPLDVDEIKQMVLDYGCPSEDKQNPGLFYLWARTRGHPQLVHATVRKLEATGWPIPGSGDGSEAEDIETIRREARSTLQEQLPSEEAKSLAYRLSILGQPFRRDHALQLGTYPPALALPGAAFDLLVGPWIERVDQTYYSVSPLLDEAAKAMWAPQHITALHKAAAEAFLSCRPHTLLEASGVLRHGLVSGAIHPVVATLNALEKLPKEVWPADSTAVPMADGRCIDAWGKDFSCDSLRQYFAASLSIPHRGGSEQRHACTTGIRSLGAGNLRD